MNSDRFKFRVWYKPYNGYVENRDHLVLLPDGVLCEYDGIEIDSDNYIVERCTGLKDKNGDLIYEGDIIRFVRQRGSYQTQKDKTAIVEFGTYRFCGFGYRENPEWPVMCALTETATKKCVIIGNIHEKDK